VLFWVKNRILLTIFTFILIISLQLPTYSAETINFNYGLLGFKIKVEDLNIFAKEGKITKHLNFYLKRVPLEKQEQVRKFLQSDYKIDPVLAYRFSRTSVGEKLLTRFGEIIQIPHNRNGFYALRAAAVQTAEDRSTGVSLINFLEHFPTDIKINLSELLQLIKNINNDRKDIEQLLDQTSLKTTNDLDRSIDNKIQELSTIGKFSTTKQTLEFEDSQRNRTLITDLYLPQSTSSISINSGFPVIVISNGLGAKRDRFEELAQHLASHGFAVVAPDHPGSDFQRQKAFLKGKYRENFDATEFIDRPLDITYLLDRLATMPEYNLDLERVGLFGYSIGGVTAFSLAGAPINFDRLQQNCHASLNLLNISTLYQCRALELPPKPYYLQDKRIKAAFLFVPFGNSLFGGLLNQITIPMMWQTVDRDYLTSLLIEQIPAFNSLGSQDKYLIISENLPHSTVTLTRQESEALANKNFARISKKYQNTLALVFFEIYVKGDREYLSYLSIDFLQSLTQKPYQLHLFDESTKILK
jgi:predicted dienelactone hydrolase